MPDMGQAKHIGDLLARRGIFVSALCVTASMALTRAHEQESGVVVCSYRVRDLQEARLDSFLPRDFGLLLLTPATDGWERPADAVTLDFPFRAGDLVSTVEMMLAKQEGRYGGGRHGNAKRSWQERNYINNAKMVLMERNHMTEQEAYRYIQKSSMDSGTNMVETAQMILLLIYDA